MRFLPKAPLAQTNWIGVNVRRKEDFRHLTGTGNFVDDISFSGMLYCALLRSPYSHARIKRTDVTRAEKLPGVVATLTGEEVAKLTDPFPQMTLPPASNVKDYCMAVTKAKYAGEPVVAVAAESRYIAEDALELIDVEYEPLEPVLDPETAIQPGSPIVHDEASTNVIAHLHFDYGNIDQAFRQADRTLKSRLHYHRFSSTPLENYAALAKYDTKTGIMHIWCNNQMPMFFLPQLGHALRLPFNRLHVVTPDIGGGFGCKILSYPYVVIAALLSRKTERPVKWIEERREHLQASSHGNERVYYVEAAYKNDGTILGFKMKALDDAGAFARHEPASSVIWAQVSPGTLRFRNLQVEFYSVWTNKCPVGPNRGYSRAQHQYAIERMIDRIARELGKDPAEVRMKNLIKRQDQPWETPNGCIYDGGDYPAATRNVMQLIDYDGWRRRQKQLLKEGRIIGVGVATTLDSGTNNFGQVLMINPRLPLAGQSEAALVQITPDGRVVVKLGSIPQGQAHETTAAQVVATELGVSVDDVSVAPGFDSESHPYTMHSGTYASQFAVKGLSASYGAAQKLRLKVFKIAAHLLRARVKDLVLANGEVFVKRNRKRNVSLRRIARTAYSNNPDLPKGMEPGLYATYIYRPPFKPPDKKKRGNLALTYSYQSHGVVLEIDPETGQPNILKYAIVDDCGRVVNPKVVEGQVHGAAAHGIAAALFEEYRYDNTGQLMTSTFMDYLAPTAMDVPSLEIESFQIPSLTSPLGTKGVGEGGGTPLPAIVNAVEDALVPFGVTLDDSHITPEKLLKLIHDNKKHAANLLESD
jgi:2-furoyl-CoA dehydrogenase large subunit